MLWKTMVENRVCVANRCEEYVNVPTVAVGHRSQEFGKHHRQRQHHHGKWTDPTLQR